MTALSAAQARADLAALAASPQSWRTALGRPEAGANARRSAVLILVGLLEESDADPALADVDLLLTRRSDDLRHHPGQVAFPGGGIDPGESPSKAAVREAVEEAGINPHGVDVIGQLADVPVVVSGNVVTPVLAWWAAPSALVVDGTETAEAFRVPIAHLVDPARRGMVHFARPGDGRVFIGPAFEVAGHVVWGFTAYVLDALLDSLGWAQPWDHERAVELP